MKISFYIIYGLILIAALVKVLISLKKERAEEKETEAFLKDLQEIAGEYSFGADLGRLVSGLSAYDFSGERANSGNLDSGREYNVIWTKEEFKVLLLLTERYGDIVREGRSLFLTGLQEIRSHGEERLLFLRKRAAVYLGLMPITALPFLMVYPIAFWAKSLFSGMDAYYYESYGAMSLTLLFILILLCLLFIYHFRFFGAYGNAVKERKVGLLHLPFISGIYSNFLYKNYPKTLKKMEDLESMGYGRDLRGFHEKIIEFTLFGAFIIGTFSAICFGGLYSFIGIIIGGLLGAFIPASNMLFKKEERKDAKEDERILLERVALMLSLRPEISIGDLLEFTEGFSNYYRKDIERMREMYRGAPDKFFECLMRSMKNEGLHNEDVFPKDLSPIYQCLISADRVPMETAFSGLRGECIYHEKELKIKKDKRDRDGAALSSFLSFLPLIFTVAVLLVLPVTLEGLGQIGAYNEGLRGLL